MAKKIFRIPAECKNLNPYFWDLKQAACEELKQNGISTEPSKAGLGTLQDICDKNPKGPLALYVSELQKSSRMNKEALLAYDMEISERNEFTKSVETKQAINNNQETSDLAIEAGDTDWDSLDNHDEFEESADLNFDEYLDQSLDQN